MPYDFQAAINAAKAAVEQQENSGGNSQYKYPLIYPPKGGTIVVRPLFNPKSGQIVRLVNRHEKIPCYRSYGIECPICKVMQQVSDMTGQDPFGRYKLSRSRGISFAQFVSSTVSIEKGNGQVIQPGEVVLFMYPWSVYTQLNTMIQAIAQSPTGMDQAFCHSNTGFYIQISVTNDYTYTTTQVPYMSFPSNMSDDEFTKMLDEMDSLNEQVIPSTITEEVDKQVKEYTDSIYRQYIAPKTPSINPNPTPVNYNTVNPVMPSIPNMTGYLPANNPMTSTAPASIPYATPGTVPASSPAAPVSTTTSDSKPSCFGGHQPGSPQCLCCPAELLCSQATPPFDT